MKPDGLLRLLVALDGPGPTEAALRLLARLDEGHDSLEVTCLFVEDEDVLRAAALPGLREVSFAGEQLPVDPDRMHEEITADAELARHVFGKAMARLGGELGPLQHQFRLTRGRAAEEFDRAAAEHDLVMVTRARYPGGLRARVGRAFAALIRQDKPVLFVNEPWASGTSVVVVGAGESRSAVDAGARLASAQRLPLVVAVAAGDAGLPLPAGADVRRLGVLDAASLAAVCHAADARLLVVPAGADVNWPELLTTLLDRLSCSVLTLPVWCGSRS